MDEPRDTRPLAPAGRGQILQFPKAGAGRQPAAATEANGSAGAGELSGAELFALLWYALTDVLGTAAAATLLRRATLRPALTFPELCGLEITRATLEYQYKVPDAWRAPAPEPPAALFELVRELWTLLVELTGSVVVARLSQVPELSECGLVPPTERRP